MNLDDYRGRLLARAFYDEMEKISVGIMDSPPGVAAQAVYTGGKKAVTNLQTAGSTAGKAVATAAKSVPKAVPATTPTSPLGKAVAKAGQAAGKVL
jgi:hypothetical protein